MTNSKNSPTRFDGQWANGRRIDPTANRPFRSAKKAWPALCDFAAASIGDPQVLDRTDINCYQGQARSFFRSCCGRYTSHDRRNYIWAPSPSNWHNFTWFMLCVGWYRGGCDEVFELEGHIAALGVAADHMFVLMDELQELFGDPLPYFNMAMEESLSDHFEHMLMHQRFAGDGRMLPDSDWTYWRFFEMTKELRSAIPTPIEDSGGSALADLLG